MRVRWLVAIAFVASCAAGACQSDEAGSGAPSSNTAEAGAGDGAVADAARRSGIFEICGFASASGQACDLIDAYVACLEAACPSELSTCFGPGYAAGDFSGGVCAEYATCATSAADPCQNDCSADATCQTCLGELVSCVQTSACQVPICPASDGGTTTDGGTGIAGTCADLEACCASLADPTAEASCNETLAAARTRAGDSDCAVVYSSYKSAGICS
jgi:hypothetical protein